MGDITTDKIIYVNDDDPKRINPNLTEVLSGPDWTVWRVDSSFLDESVEINGVEAAGYLVEEGWYIVDSMSETEMLERAEAIERFPRIEVQHLLADRGLTVSDLARLASCSPRQAKYYRSGAKLMSELELRGLESLPKKRGPKKKEIA